MLSNRYTIETEAGLLNTKVIVVGLCLLLVVVCSEDLAEGQQQIGQRDYSCISLNQIFTARQAGDSDHQLSGYQATFLHFHFQCPFSSIVFTTNSCSISSMMGRLCLIMIE